MQKALINEKMDDIREMQKKAWSMKQWVQNVREMLKALD